MKISKILFFCSILCLFHMTTYANDTVAPQLNTIVVEGTSNLSTVPDQATIQIGITTSAADANTAEIENAQVANQIQAALQSLGINKKEIKTTHYNFYPAYNNENNKSHEIIAYTVNNTVSVTINDLTKVGTIIDSSIKAGANTIHSIDFTVKDDTAAKTSAIVSAVENAKAKATVIAKAINKKIINVITVRENGVYIQPSTSRYALMKNAASDSTTGISPGDININATVEVIFEIQ